MNDKKINLLYQFIGAESQKIEKKFLKMKKTELIKNAWRLAKLQNIYDAIIYYCESWQEDDCATYFPLKEETVDKILDGDNMIEKISDRMSDVRHAERYNLEDWEEDLPFLINEVVSWED